MDRKLQCGLNEGQDPPPEQVGLLDIKRSREKSMQLVCLSPLLPGECMSAAAAAAVAPPPLCPSPPLAAAATAAAASFFDFRLQLLWVPL